MMRFSVAFASVLLVFSACKSRSFSDGEVASEGVRNNSVKGKFRCEGGEPNWAFAVNTSSAFFKGPQGEFTYKSGEGRSADGAVSYELMGEKAEVVAHISKEKCIDRGSNGPQDYKLMLIVNKEEVKGLCCDLLAGSGGSGSYSCSRTEPGISFTVNPQTAKYVGVDSTYSFKSGVGRSHDGGFGWELNSNKRPNAVASIFPKSNCTNRNEDAPKWTHSINLLMDGTEMNGCCVKE